MLIIRSATDTEIGSIRLIPLRGYGRDGNKSAPSSVPGLSRSTLNIATGMIRYYLFIALKHIRKQKMFSFINLVGLTIGITCCLTIFLFIIKEISYDGFHKNGKHHYRIMRSDVMDGQGSDTPWVSPPNARALIRLKKGHMQHVIERIKKMYVNGALDFPFEYSFLDERLNDLH